MILGMPEPEYGKAIVNPITGRARTSLNQRNIRRNSNYDASSRPFIAWDGEGSNLSGSGQAQHYILFGSSVCDTPLTGYQLEGQQCIDYLLKVAVENPEAIHISFAFGYDVNMILYWFSRDAQMKIAKGNDYYYTYTDPESMLRYRYRLEWRKSKYFAVWRKVLGKNTDGAKPDISIKVYDIFSYFQSSFVKACDKWLNEEELAETREIVAHGKTMRDTVQSTNDVLIYWKAEIAQLQLLAARLREAMFDAGFNLPEWHGPGVVAGTAMKMHGIKAHKKDTSKNIQDATRYAYMAGRFELFQVGHWNQPVYEMDINSAYPYFIAQLPSLSEGYWEYIETPEVIEEFGVYHIQFIDEESALCTIKPQPFFHRAKTGAISFPNEVDNWYWSPEAKLANRHNAAVLEGWVYRGWTTRPFDWVNEMFDQRKQWQNEGKAAERALKLCMNSLYGKTAQRIGWNKERYTAPAWHQLEWAGWVTSGCRAMIMSTIDRITFPNVIAIETDAIYTTTNPSDINIKDSSALGGWGIQKWDEVYYVQNGLASLRKDDIWKTKYRGMDAGSVDENTMRNFIDNIHVGEPWPKINVTTSRFVGLGLALKTKAPHCVWQMNMPKTVNVGIMGKRRHHPNHCPTCISGIPGPHFLITWTPNDIKSSKHKLDWIDLMDEMPPERENDMEPWE